MKVELRDKERIDDLQRNGYQIIQNREKFCFGMDAVLLTGFAHARERDTMLDLGTGTGIIPLLMEAKYHCSHLTGLEIQEESADMARRSVALNDLQNRIDIVTGDIRRTEPQASVWVTMSGRQTRTLRRGTERQRTASIGQGTGRSR